MTGSIHTPSMSPHLPITPRQIPSFAAYYTKIVKAIDDLVGQRLLLCEGAQPELNRLVAQGLARGVPAGTAPSAVTFSHGAMTRAGRSGHFK